MLAGVAAIFAVEVERIVDEIPLKLSTEGFDNIRVGNMWVELLTRTAAD